MSLEQAGIREGIPGHGRDRGRISWKVPSHPNHSGILGFTRDPMAELTSGALEPLESLPVLLPMDLDHHGRRGLDSGKIPTWEGLSMGRGGVPIPRGIANPCGCGPWGRGLVLGMVGFRDLGAIFQRQRFRDSVNSH